MSIKHCLFCEVVMGKAKSFKVWEDEKFLLFLDTKPIKLGHVLLVPKIHFDNVFEIEESFFNLLFMKVREILPILKKATLSKRIGVVVEGLGVPHAHIHLVPINNGDELNPSLAKKVSDEDLAETQAVLSKSFN